MDTQQHNLVDSMAELSLTSNADKEEWQVPFSSPSPFNTSSMSNARGERPSDNKFDCHTKPEVAHPHVTSPPLPELATGPSPLTDSFTYKFPLTPARWDTDADSDGASDDGDDKEHNNPFGTFSADGSPDTSGEFSACSEEGPATPRGEVDIDILGDLATIRHYKRPYFSECEDKDEWNRFQVGRLDQLMGDADVDSDEPEHDFNGIVPPPASSLASRRPSAVACTLGLALGLSLSTPGAASELIKSLSRLAINEELGAVDSTDQEEGGDSATTAITTTV